ncbi:hypothetical protein [Sphingomonas rhizophila]|uniref:hypothetical protein n=1 Tax=Sphingomonas rhizophila TaxID=2071607 RepID=UPI0031B567B7
MGEAVSPAVFTIPAHRSFADALVAGLLRRHGDDPLALARGRLLLPNNRAVRSITEAFVRASGAGLVLPRLIAIGDPDLDERVGEALDPLDLAQPVPRRSIRSSGNCFWHHLSARMARARQKRCALPPILVVRSTR